LGTNETRLQALHLFILGAPSSPWKHEKHIAPLTASIGVGRSKILGLDILFSDSGSKMLVLMRFVDSENAYEVMRMKVVGKSRNAGQSFRGLA